MCDKRLISKSMCRIYHMDRWAERTFITFGRLSAPNDDWNTFNLNLTTPFSRRHLPGTGRAPAEHR